MGKLVTLFFGKNGEGIPFSLKNVLFFYFVSQNRTNSCGTVLALSTNFFSIFLNRAKTCGTALFFNLFLMFLSTQQANRLRPWNFYFKEISMEIITDTTKIFSTTPPSRNKNHLFSHHLLD